MSSRERLGRGPHRADGEAHEELRRLPVQSQLCRKWAEISDGVRRRGRPVGVADAWIAATALLHGMPLVIHNREHFSDIEGLEVVYEAP